MPTYSDRAPNTLVDFIDDLGRKWFNFLESNIGQFAIPREEIAQGMDGAEAFLSRAIVLPGES